MDPLYFVDISIFCLILCAVGLAWLSCFVCSPLGTWKRYRRSKQLIREIQCAVTLAKNERQMRTIVRRIRLLSLRTELYFSLQAVEIRALDKLHYLSVENTPITGQT